MLREMVWVIEGIRFDFYLRGFGFRGDKLKGIGVRSREIYWRL